MKKLLSIYFILISMALNAQNPSFMWAKSIIHIGPLTGKWGATCIASDTIGNAYVAGCFNDTTDFNPGAGSYLLRTTTLGTNNGFVAMYDMAGNFVWVKQLGGISSFSEIWSLNLDMAGNIYLTGIFGGTIDFDPGPGIYNLTSATYSDVFILKLDSNGNFLWAKAVKGNYESRATSISLDAYGNIYIGGYFTGTTDFDPGAGIANFTSSTSGYFDLFILKLDNTGGYLWAKTIGGGLDEFNYSLKADSAGNVYATGSFHDTVDFDPGAGIFNLVSSSFFYADSYILKLDASGSLVWAKNVGGAFDEYGIGLSLDSASNVYTIGSYWGTADFDPDTSSSFNLSGGSGYVLKLDSTGHFIWAKSMDNGIHPVGMTTDNSANIYTSGWFIGTIDFDPGAAVTNLSSLTTQDMFISKFDASGNFKSAVGIGGTSVVASMAIATDVFKNIYTTGRYFGIIDFNPGNSVYNLTGNSDAFVLKLTQGDPVSSIFETATENDFNFFPNPVNEKLIVHSSDRISEITITNALGEIVSKYSEGPSGSLIIDVSGLKTGIYFISATYSDKVIFKKMVKQ